MSPSATAAESLHDPNECYLAESPFHNPRLNIVHEGNARKVLEITGDFILTRHASDRIRQAFLREIDRGLSAHPEHCPEMTCRDLQMEITGVYHLPDGTESGDFLALDLGSTNFRVLLSRLYPHSPDEFRVKYYDVPPNIRKGPSKRLFEFLASCLGDFVNTYEDLREGGGGRRQPLGFTFSFPVRQASLNKAHLVTWTKTFDCPDSVGRDVVELLNEAIQERGLAIDVVACLNDTTGTLVKGAYLDHECCVGVIVGSGFNACYMERVDRIEKWPAARRAREAAGEEVIIDCECGAFGDNGSLDFIRTDIDDEIDRDALHPGSFTYEKLLAGNFVGKIVRRLLLAMIHSGALFGGKITTQLSEIDSIQASDISAIEAEEEISPESSGILMDIFTKLGYSTGDISGDDVEIVRYTCARVIIRSALLVACVLSVLVSRIDRPRVAIAVDGSLYAKHPKIHRLMHDFIAEMIPDREFKLIHAEDGSGKGAGLVAAVAHKNIKK